MYEAAESWGRAVRDRCGERHVCGPSFAIESYGSLWKRLDAGTDAEVLHATIRALPLCDEHRCSPMEYP